MNDMMEYWKQEWNAQRQGLNKWRDAWELTADQSKATNVTVPSNGEWVITDKILKKVQQIWFPGSENPTEMIIENLSSADIDHLNSQKGLGRTLCRIKIDGDKRTIKGPSRVQFNKILINNDLFVLFCAMGHELVHVSQYKALAGIEYSINEKEDFNSLLDYYAYEFQHQIDGMFITPDETEDDIEYFPSIKNRHPEWVELMNWRSYEWANPTNCRERYEQNNDFTVFPQ